MKITRQSSLLPLLLYGARHNVGVAASFFSSPRLASSEFSAVHKADALRLLLVYKFGGFYLDLDYVVLNSLSHHNNIVVGNQPWDQL